MSTLSEHARHKLTRILHRRAPAARSAGYQPARNRPADAPHSPAGAPRTLAGAPGSSAGPPGSVAGPPRSSAGPPGSSAGAPGSVAGRLVGLPGRCATLSGWSAAGGERPAAAWRKLVNGKVFEVICSGGRLDGIVLPFLGMIGHDSADAIQFVPCERDAPHVAFKQRRSGTFRGRTAQEHGHTLRAIRPSLRALAIGDDLQWRTGPMT